MGDLLHAVRTRIFQAKTGPERDDIEEARSADADFKYTVRAVSADSAVSPSDAPDADLSALTALTATAVSSRERAQDAEERLSLMTEGCDMPDKWAWALRTISDAGPPGNVLESHWREAVDVMGHVLDVASHAYVHQFISET